MPSIENFREIRRDGKIVYPNTTPAEFAALGKVERIVEIQWMNGSRAISRRSVHGISADLVPGGEYIVVNEDNESHRNRIVEVLNADGTVRFTLPKTQIIRGKDVAGEYLWLPKPRTNAPHVFAIVFEPDGENYQYQLDINAVDGTVIGEYETR